MSILEFLKDNNVFVFDTETTGLPEKCPGVWGTYWDYKLNEKYNSSRILSIAWSLVKNFNKENINVNDIQHFLRYPEGFTEILNTNIHGISFQDTLTKGMPFGLILESGGLGQALLNANYIIAHNVNFDYNILMNELHRLTIIDEQNDIQIALTTRELAVDCITHLLDLKKNYKIICTGELTTNICKMSFPSKNNYLGKKQSIKYKMPKLCELYKYIYGYDFENAHSANGDVKALLEVMIKL